MISAFIKRSRGQSLASQNLRLFSVTHTFLDQFTPSDYNSLIRKHKVVVFSLESCSYCMAAKFRLAEKDI